MYFSIQAAAMGQDQKFTELNDFVDFHHYPSAFRHTFVAPFVVKAASAVIGRQTGPGHILFRVGFPEQFLSYKAESCWAYAV